MLLYLNAKHFLIEKLYQTQKVNYTFQLIFRKLNDNELRVQVIQFEHKTGSRLNLHLDASHSQLLSLSGNLIMQIRYGKQNLQRCLKF